MHVIPSSPAVDLDGHFFRVCFTSFGVRLNEQSSTQNRRLSYLSLADEQFWKSYRSIKRRGLTVLFAGHIFVDKWDLVVLLM